MTTLKKLITELQNIDKEIGSHKTLDGNVSFHIKFKDGSDSIWFSLGPEDNNKIEIDSRILPGCNCVFGAEITIELEKNETIY